MSQNTSSNASELVGERDGEDVVMQPLLGRLEPRLKPVTIPALRLDQYNPRGLNEQNAQVAIAAFRYGRHKRIQGEGYTVIDAGRAISHASPADCQSKCIVPFS
jgi:hypothetical protein